MCAGEAPGLEQFARANQASLQVVGLGTQDSLSDGKRFASVHHVTFPLLWEDGYDSWSPFRITRQPASVLVSADGQELKRWQGALRQSDHEEVLRTIGAAGP